MNLDFDGKLIFKTEYGVLLLSCYIIGRQIIRRMYEEKKSESSAAPGEAM